MTAHEAHPGTNARNVFILSRYASQTETMLRLFSLFVEMSIFEVLSLSVSSTSKGVDVASAIADSFGFALSSSLN